MTVEKPKQKQLLRPITTGANSSMNQSQFLAITCNSLKAREKSRVHGAIGIGFASHWLKKWHVSFKSITKSSNRNHVITFDSHLKTAPKPLDLPWKTRRKSNSSQHGNAPMISRLPIQMINHCAKGDLWEQGT